MCNESKDLERAVYNLQLKNSKIEIHQKWSDLMASNTTGTRVDLFIADGSTDGCKGTAIKTDATNLDDFLSSFSIALIRAMSQFSDDERSGTACEHVSRWIRQGYTIGNKLQGYKADDVNEERVMWCGDVTPHPTWHRSSSTGI
jgi:hypothetical protein